MSLLFKEAVLEANTLLKYAQTRELSVFLENFLTSHEDCNPCILSEVHIDVGNVIWTSSLYLSGKIHCSVCRNNIECKHWTGLEAIKEHIESLHDIYLIKQKQNVYVPELQHILRSCQLNQKIDTFTPTVLNMFKTACHYIYALTLRHKSWLSKHKLKYHSI